MEVNDLFDRVQLTWGLRGDPHLWEAMRVHFQAVKIVDEEGLIIAFYTAFESITGHDLNGLQEDIYQPEFNTGGMSGGWLSVDFWKHQALPHLQKNWRKHHKSNKNE